MEVLKKLTFRSLMFGCDPEFFFSKDGRIIGSDRVLPEEGLIYKSGDIAGIVDGRHTSLPGSISKVIIDGVQAELNPRANTCRANLGNEIGACFRKLVQHMEVMKNIHIDFSQTIELGDDDMDELSDRSKTFGCMPSFNAHDGGKQGSISVDASVYKYRSAGGHIHLGDTGTGSFAKEIKEALLQRERVVNMLDLIVGNTCVLVDRDSGNIERRKVYGRAGEFRTPPHGIEYRTPSNFWLRNYKLMSMVMGLCRTAVLIVADNLDDKFLELVSMSDVARAINDNDFDLAYSNFKKIEKLLMSITPLDTEHFDLNESTLEMFHHFVKKGLDYWFTTPPLESWITMQEGHNSGFGSFLTTTVAGDMKTNG